MPTLVKPSALPKSRSGRTAKPLDQKFVAALAAAIEKTPSVNDRPALHENSDTFSTKGRASADGRRYADAVQEILSTDHPDWKISVRIKENAKDSFSWGVYARLVEVESTNGTPTE